MQCVFGGAIDRETESKISVGDANSTNAGMSKLLEQEGTDAMRNNTLQEVFA